MDLRSAILQGFDYDQWANTKWVANLGQFRDMLRAQEILEHILFAHKTWLSRCGIDWSQAQFDVPLADLFGASNDLWRAVITDQQLSARVTYETSNGSEHRNTLEEIARHVLLHGAYHRGQLRGLIELEGGRAFPETDFIFFLREFGD
ncbi:MAG: DinB family protein [Fimbriimonadaceae bacterium]|uniref:DinB family protein n=1 Tax=Candidatus Nitrosymbiomonas proteolyticus TaxID=2608984 RepID=A0A809S5H9_9BACT|nr:MAG: hypothetical protein EDM74_01655 [Armatimonadota bacterium]KXK19819.1 MAG: DinB family protein [Armatimonadetes bacterium OLB18]WKZ80458.1 MAG: DinB family protein [Fimbriimonadaceae bacterium]BBO24257.1 DinB family protein [Candidatus Nitrosymbiomonas proteolyticus]MBL1152745.1 hypothetical protein [Armatimonadota bacterium]